MRMSLAHDGSDDLGRLDRLVGRVPTLAVHEPQNPPLYRLQSVARVWNRPRVRADPVLRVRVLNRRGELFLADLLGIESHR